MEADNAEPEEMGFSGVLLKVFQKVWLKLHKPKVYFPKSKAMTIDYSL